VLFKFKTFKRLYLALSAVTIVVLLGSLGYFFIENYTLVEAFYMTIITVSTVGFREVNELSQDGMIFTSILFISSIGACKLFVLGISE
jgi:voltage-gated potassium channel